MGSLGFSHFAPIPQNGDVIANLQQLFKFVRNVNDGHAVGLQFADHPEQNFHLRCAQGRGRFIHNQDAYILSQSFGNLDNLLLANAQVANQFMRADDSAQAA